MPISANVTSAFEDYGLKKKSDFDYLRHNLIEYAKQIFVQILFL